MFVGDLIEAYVGKAFEIDCIDIEIHGIQDHQPPLFKGPGVIRGAYSGELSFKLYNQIPITKDIHQFLNWIRSGEHGESTCCRLFAKDYDGISWSGAWFVPRVDLFQGTEVQNFTIQGKFSQLATRIGKVKGDQDKDLTELIFAGTLDLPFTGRVCEKRFHGRKVMSRRYWSDHHKLNFKGSKIVFQKSDVQNRIHIEATHNKGFTPPNVENWITEALIFVTARMVYPRMVVPW
jgi:hypothetical protein